MNSGATQSYGVAGVGNTWSLYGIGPGYLSVAGWTYGSDKRLKENIIYFDTGIDKINQLKPVRFDYINGSKDQIGFIAQDVQSVIPEAVIITDNNTGMLGLKTDFIIPYLVNAIQELKLEKDSEIQQLKSQNDELKARIEVLERR